MKDCGARRAQRRTQHLNFLGRDADHARRRTGILGTCVSAMRCTRTRRPKRCTARFAARAARRSFCSRRRASRFRCRSPRRKSPARRWRNRPCSLACVPRRAPAPPRKTRTNFASARWSSNDRSPGTFRRRCRRRAAGCNERRCRCRAAARVVVGDLWVRRLFARLGDERDQAMDLADGVGGGGNFFVGTGRQRVFQRTDAHLGCWRPVHVPRNCRARLDVGLGRRIFGGDRRANDL